jgi:hypothetical protein
MHDRRRLVDCRTWEPIVSGAVAAEGRASALAVAEEIWARDQSGLSVPNLCDLALVCAYLALAEASEEWRERAITYVNAAIERVSTGGYLSHSLYGGVTGVGWVAEHVCTVLEVSGEDETDAEPSDPLEDVDALVLDRLRQSSWADPYDLIRGLVGIGVYLLERLPVARASQGLELVLQQLEAIAVHSQDGIAWYTPPEHLPEYKRQRHPAGHYDLGVAHGVAGVIYLLAELVHHDVDVARSRSLLEGAVAWLLARQRSPDSVSRFGAVFVPDEPIEDTRLAWCYGDLGIAAVLHHAARRVGRDEWNRVARNLFDHCLHWPPDRDWIADACLCHGALGVAHLFNRVYQEDGDRTYREAAVRWYQRGLAMREPGAGIGGFRAVTPQPVKSLTPDLSLLMGAPGAALALVSAFAAVEPQWDRILLLSGRPRYIPTHLTACDPRVRSR